MKRIRKVIALCLLFTLVVSNAVFAEVPTLSELNDKYLSDMVDIERVYKYDFIEGRAEAEEQGEVLNFPSAVQIVTALGIMEYLDDGSFGEDKNVPFNEFSQIIMELSVGNVADYEALYEEYGETRPTTLGEAMYWLVEAIGHHVYEAKYSFDNPRYYIAERLGLLKGIANLPDKLVTRGELASMIAKAIEIDRVQLIGLGESEIYEVIEDSSLLNDKFSVILIEGVVTAVPGMRIYAGETLEKGEIEIDRVVYNAENLDCSRYFGHRILAVVESDDYSENIISVEISEDDNTVRIPISDISEISKSRLAYLSDGEEHRVSLGGITTVTRNGESSDISLISDSLLTENGEIILCSGSGDEDYDVAAVRLYQDFVIKSVSSHSKMIYLSYGQKLNGMEYIKADVPKGHALNIMKNGEVIPYTSLNSGDVVTVTANDDSSVISMVVSDKTVSGSVTQINGNEALIGDEYYIISEAYENSVLVDTTIPELNVGLSGDFILSFDGRIVNIKSTGDMRHYGYMTGIQKGKALDDSVTVRMFTDEGAWEDYKLAEKLTFDGDEKTERGTAYEIMGAAYDEIVYNIVRYSLNANDEISFLDTARTKSLQLGEVDSEAGDARRIIPAGEWSGTFNWKASGALTGSKYLLASNTTVFSIPSDVEDTELYAVTKKPSFGSNQQGNLLLYSPDEFNTVPVVVQTTTGGAIDQYNMKYFIVTGLYETLNKNGEPINGIRCLDYLGSGTWEMREYVGKPSMYGKFDIEVGDLVFYAANSNEIQDYVIRVKKTERDVDISSNLLSYPAYGLGTITDISAENNLIKFVTGTTEVAFKPMQIGLHETGAKLGRSASIGDLRVGDRIFAFGSHKASITFASAKNDKLEADATLTELVQNPANANDIVISTGKIATGENANKYAGGFGYLLGCLDIRNFDADKSMDVYYEPLQKWETKVKLGDLDQRVQLFSYNINYNGLSGIPENTTDNSPVVLQNGKVYYFGTADAADTTAHELELSEAMTKDSWYRIERYMDFSDVKDETTYNAYQRIAVYKINADGTESLIGDTGETWIVAGKQARTARHLSIFFRTKPGSYGSAPTYFDDLRFTQRENGSKIASQAVEGEESIDIEFSEALFDESSWEGISLIETGTSDELVDFCGYSGGVLTVNLIEALKANGEYTLTVPAEAISSTDGVLMKEDFTITFTAAPLYDTLEVDTAKILLNGKAITNKTDLVKDGSLMVKVNLLNKTGKSASYVVFSVLKDASGKLKGIKMSEGTVPDGMDYAYVTTPAISVPEEDCRAYIYIWETTNNLRPLKTATYLAE